MGGEGSGFRVKRFGVGSLGFELLVLKVEVGFGTLRVDKLLGGIRRFLGLPVGELRAWSRAGKLKLFKLCRVRGLSKLYGGFPKLGVLFWGSQ